MIDPNNTTTVRVGQLPWGNFNLNDNLPHEIDSDLHKGSLKELADFIGDYLGSVEGSAFNPTTVNDGGNLPVTSKKEWIIVGKGTFLNSGGAPNITTTKELNVLTSNGSFWVLSVEIPISVDFDGITQSIRSGYTKTAPSEDAVFTAIQNVLSDIPDSSKLDAFPDSLIPGKILQVDNNGQNYRFIDLPANGIEQQSYPRLPVSKTEFYIPDNRSAVFASVNGAMYNLEDDNTVDEYNTFTQIGNIVTFKEYLEPNNLIIIYHQQKNLN